MIVLSEETPHQPAISASAQDTVDMTQAVRFLGCRIYHLPTDFRECENAENALWHVPEQDEPTLGVWTGFIPSPERYTAIYEELLRKRIHLPNTPEEHLIALEFDRAYPRLEGITPETCVLTSPEKWQAAGEQLGYPLFVRGTARSRKADGWKACVAQGPEELQALVEQLFAIPYRSRGRVLVRRLVPLRHSRRSDEGFPLGREYRVFLYGPRVLASGYYWEGDDPLRPLAPAEEAEMLGLAVEAARRVQVPFVCVDVGQKENGEWTVIEVGDAQFAGASQIPLIPLWKAILSIEEEWQPPEESGTE